MPSLIRSQVLATLFVLAGSSMLLAAWNFQDVDAPPSFPRGSLRLDGAGNPAIAYGEDQLHYAAWDGSSWTLQVIDENCVGFSDLAFDGTGQPAISYIGSGGVVHLARWDGSGWRIQQVGEAYSVASLAFDATGQPALAYLSQSFQVVYASWDGSAWSVEEVEARPWEFRDFWLDFDGAGQPVIGYTAVPGVVSTEVRVARLNGAVWEVETLAGGSWGTDSVELTSLAIDAAGEPAVTWERLNDGGGTSLTLARWDGASWDHEQLIASPSMYGFHSCLAFDSAGRPLIAHREGDGIALSEWDGSAWLRRPVTDSGLRPSLAIAPGDVPLVASLDPVTRALELARWSGSAWTSQEIDRSAQVGLEPSLALDSADRPAVSYYHSLSSTGFAPAELRFARWDGAAWEIEVLDQIDDYQDATSLAFDALDQPAVAYRDNDRDELRLARWDGAAWSIDVIAGDAYGHFSLAFDSGGLPAVSYYSISGGSHLALARWNGSTWDTEVVDAGSGGDRSSLAFDGNGHPAISYHDGANRELRLARWDGSGWSVEVVDEAHLVGQHTHLAFNPAFRPAIAYKDGDARLTLARHDGAGWLFETVGSGLLHDFAFDAGGQPVLTTYLLDRRIFFNYKDGTVWRQELIADGAAYASLSLDSGGRPLVAYREVCLEDLRIATVTGPATLHRGLAPTLEPGWRTAALPLTSTNDDETPPFPLETAVPGSHQDDLGSGGEALRLYRVLWSGDRPARNTLKLVKDPAGVALTW